MNIRVIQYIICFLLVNGSLYAQKNVIFGKVLDSTSEHALDKVTVAVYKLKDSALFEYQLSDTNGQFSFRNIPENRYKVVFSSTGYRTARRFITKVAEIRTDLGIILMDKIDLSLDTVIIYSEKPPVLVKDQMIEFDASAFQTPANSLVEDLLRKLPGIQIDNDGNLFFNGKKVNRITVDGRNFFGNDPKSVTRNLPANIVEKVQVKPDFDELEKNPNSTIAALGNQINISLKKEAKNVWFGKLYGTMGTSKRYEAGLSANVFKEKYQIGIFSFANNINRSNFTLQELQSLGGNSGGSHPFIRSDYASQSSFLSSNLSLFYSDELGISDSKGAAVHIGLSPSNKKSFFCQIFSLNKQRSTIQQINNRQSVGDTTIFTNSDKDESNRTQSSAVNFGGTFRNSKYLDVRYSINYANIQSINYISSDIEISNDKVGQQSIGIGEQKVDTRYKYVAQEMVLTKRFKGRDKRRLTLFESFAFQNGKKSDFSDYHNQIYIPSPMISNFYQLRLQDNQGSFSTFSITYSEPIYKSIILKYNGRIDLSRSTDVTQTFLKSMNNLYDSLDLNNEFIQNTFRFKNTMSVVSETKKRTITLGANLQFHDLKYTFSKNFNSKLNYTNLFPFVRINWKSNIVDYTIDRITPSAQYLTPIADSSNPFYVIVGNPGLIPSITQRLNFNGFGIDEKKHTFYNISLYSTLVYNDIILTRKIGSTGAQTFLPMNINGTRTGSLSLELGKDFKQNTRVTYSVKFGNSVSFVRKKIEVNDIRGNQSSVSYSPKLLAACAKSKLFDLRFSYEFNIASSKYSLPYFKSTKFKEQKWEGNLSWTPSNLVIIQSNATYRNFDVASNSNIKNILLLNFSFAHLILKEKGQIKASVFDLLNKNRGIIQYNMNNYYSVATNNSLRRYLSISFLYNFKQQSKSKS